MKRAYLDCPKGTYIESMHSDYLWFGNDIGNCLAHTTSLKSLRAIRALCNEVIYKRERINKRKRGPKK